MRISYLICDFCGHKSEVPLNAADLLPLLGIHIYDHRTKETYDFDFCDNCKHTLLVDYLKDKVKPL